MRTTIVSLWLGVAALGCGGNGASAEGPPAATAGDESTVEPSESVALEARRTGTATLALVAMVAGQPTPASVRVLDARGALQAVNVR